MVELLIIISKELSIIIQSNAKWFAGCRTNEYIISRNEVITPPDIVEASHETPIVLDSPAEKVLYFGYNGEDLYTWCSDTSDNNPYVIIRFSQPVFITSFLSSGSTDHSFSTLKTFYVPTSPWSIPTPVEILTTTQHLVVKERYSYDFFNYIPNILFQNCLPNILYLICSISIKLSQ